MLDAETKRKIDNCRDVLVGKIPDPKSQVEQITIALIYKFMDDMDQLSVEQGGKPSFFRGEFEKYSWSSIFNPRISGFELLNLYGESINKMEHNPNIPQLFRDIFKNAFLPYRDPETLRLFLKEISGFTYDHSERLGDAFEYLLSVLSSQGEAGQFRTPRHIIDFIVKVVDPQLNQTVLDPACGTAGFLISAYKHILKNNPKLSVSQKQRLMNNFVGYDISYDMVRLSLVNMYLHGFPQPHIHEYDTLTYEDRWPDTFDVIMANPPFMTPKGGIRPHSRFSIKAKRSEVLFVDYIAEHLNPSGRAGVIVPEGIIFQSQNAYKALRKMLIENYLWAVVSLPAGVFNPYSGVKTSILLMDKSLAKRIDQILFVKIENDGYDLGAQRRPIDKNDLPAAEKFLNIYKSKIENGEAALSKRTCPEQRRRSASKGLKSEILNPKSDISPLAHAVPKSDIVNSGDYNLSGDRYRPVIHHRINEYETVELTELCDEIKSGFAFGKANETTGDILHLRPMNISTDGNLVFEGSKYVPRKQLKDEYFVRKDDILFNNTNSKELVGKTCFVDKDIVAVFSNHITRIRVNKKTLPRFVSLVLHNLFSKGYFANLCHEWVNQVGIGNKVLTKTKIPLPPLDFQEKIVAEIDGYQKIIDAARQIVQSYKPTIKINPNWPIVGLGQLCDYIGSGITPLGGKEVYQESGVLFIRSQNVLWGTCDFSDAVFVSNKQHDEMIRSAVRKNDVLLNITGASIGRCAVYSSDEPANVNQHVVALRCIEKKIHPYYLMLNMLGEKIQTYIWSIQSGGTRQALNYKQIREFPISLPPLDEQKRIVAEIESEQKIVNENKKLIEIFSKKISDTVSSLWS